MKRPNITPGEWGNSFPFITSSSDTICDCLIQASAADLDEIELNEMRANARAISTLPDLLEALENALSVIEDLPYPENRAAGRIEAALKKAGYTF